jgi:hypothetical protein
LELLMFRSNMLLKLKNFFILGGHSVTLHVIFVKYM